MCYNAAGKFCVLLFFVGLLVLGTAFLTIGVFPFGSYTPKQYQDLYKLMAKRIRNFFICSGAFAILVCVLALTGVSIVACCYCEDKCLFYWLALAVVLAIIFDIVVIVEFSKMKSRIGDYFLKALRGYGVDDTVTALVDKMHETNFCCGIYGPMDFSRLNKSIPSSCRCSGVAPVGGRGKPGGKARVVTPVPPDTGKFSRIGGRISGEIDTPDIIGGMNNIDDESDTRTIDTTIEPTFQLEKRRKLYPAEEPLWKMNNFASRNILSMTGMYGNLTNYSMISMVDNITHQEKSGMENDVHKLPISSDLGFRGNASVRIEYELPVKNLTDIKPIDKPSDNKSGTSMFKCNGCLDKLFDDYNLYIILFYICAVLKMVFTIAVGVSPCWCLIIHEIEDSSDDDEEN